MNNPTDIQTNANLQSLGASYLLEIPLLISSVVSVSPKVILAFEMDLILSMECVSLSKLISLLVTLSFTEFFCDDT